MTDAVEKVFFGWRTKILKTADAFRARRPEDPHRFIRKRPPAFVLAPEYLAAAAVPKKRLSRDFRCLSIFDFFDSIDPERKSRSASAVFGSSRFQELICQPLRLIEHNDVAGSDILHSVPRLVGFALRQRFVESGVRIFRNADIGFLSHLFDCTRQRH